MKKQKISFLFFLICCFFYKPVVSQVAIDSSTYYYKFIKAPIDSHSLTKAYIYFQRHKQQCLENKDTLRAILDLRYIANIQQELGNLNESESTLVDALILLNQVAQKDVILEYRIGIFNELGMIYRKLENYEKAIEYFNNILSVAKAPEHLSAAYNNRALTYSNQKKYDLAQKDYQKALDLSIEIGDSLKIAKNLNNLAFVEFKLDRPSAFSNMQKAHSIRKSLNNLPNLYSSYKHLSNYHKEKNRRDSALFYATAAYELAKKINSISYKEDALSQLLKLQKDSLVLNYVYLKDSIEKSQQASQNQYASMKYNVSREQKKTADAKIQQEQEKRQKLFYQALGIILLLLSGFVFILLRNKYKKDKQKEIYNTEIRISKKVHDEVANDVYQMMTKLQTGDQPNLGLMDDLENIYHKTRDISKEISIIDVRENYATLINDLLSGYQSVGVSVLTRNMYKIEWSLFSDDKKRALYRVLQELMTNMKKHSRATHVIIEFQQKRKRLTIIYKDNGIGCHLQKHTGLQNTENRIIAVNGIITFTSQPDKGFQTKIVI